VADIVDPALRIELYLARESLARYPAAKFPDPLQAKGKIIIGKHDPPGAALYQRPDFLCDGGGIPYTDGPVVLSMDRTEVAVVITAPA
jgi:hypothetical protein